MVGFVDESSWCCMSCVGGAKRAATLMVATLTSANPTATLIASPTATPTATHTTTHIATLITTPTATPTPHPQWWHWTSLMHRWRHSTGWWRPCTARATGCTSSTSSPCCHSRPHSTRGQVSGVSVMGGDRHECNGWGGVKKMGERGWCSESKLRKHVGMFCHLSPITALFSHSQRVSCLWPPPLCSGATRSCTRSGRP